MKDLVNNVIDYVNFDARHLIIYYLGCQYETHKPIIRKAWFGFEELVTTTKCLDNNATEKFTLNNILYF